MNSTIRKLLTYIKKYKIQILFSLAISAMSVWLSLYIPIIVANAIDYIVGKNQVDFTTIFGLLLQIVQIAIVVAILQWMINIINNKITFLVARDLRNDALKKLERVPLKYIDSNQHGDIVSRVISDVDQIVDGLLMGFTQIFTGVLTILITLFFMFSINYKMAIIVIVLTPLSLFIAKFISKRTYHLFEKQSEIRGEETAFLNEMVVNQKTVIAYGEEKNNIDKFIKINNRLEEVGIKASFFSAITNPCTRFVNNIVYACVAFAGASFAIAGNLSVGGLTCFLNYANQYTNPFNEISGVLTELQNAFASAKRIFEVIEQEEEKDDGKGNLENVQGKVEFKEVEFGYTENKMILDGINFVVEPGTKIAIVGPTGCGKTTLINLLMRFYDLNSGKILIDQKDITDVNRTSLRKSFGMVLQDTWIKKGTIRENIKLGKPEATDEDVIQAAKSAMAYNFIKRLPEGFETIVENNDSILSEGERQLISIARVMLLDPPMLILDEATSNIDTRTEQKVQKAFAKLMKGRTSFVVAHRLSTIVSADIILVMKNGEIIEKGKHQELLESGGFYAKLYNSQYKIC